MPGIFQSEVTLLERETCKTMKLPLRLGPRRTLTMRTRHRRLQLTNSRPSIGRRTCLKVDHTAYAYYQSGGCQMQEVALKDMY